METCTWIEALRGYRRGALLLALGLMILLVSRTEVWGHAADGHPARIHKGSCSALGPVAFRLNGVGASVDLEQRSIATPAAVNPDLAYQVMTSETMIPVSLETLLADDYAVMIYDDDVDMQGVACGSLGGAMLGDTLVTALAEMGVPGHSGFALFQPNGEQTEVTVLIGHGLTPLSSGGLADMAGMPGMDMSTPAP